MPYNSEASFRRVNLSAMYFTPSYLHTNNSYHSSLAAQTAFFFFDIRTGPNVKETKGSLGGKTTTIDPMLIITA